MRLPPPDHTSLPPDWPPDRPGEPQPVLRTEADGPDEPVLRIEAIEAIEPDETGGPDEVGATDAAFATFYRTSWDQVARGLAATVGDPALAAEATDEAMARAYERWAKVGGYDFPAGWVYRVGLNWARSHHRRLMRSLPVHRNEPARLGPVTDPSVRAALLDLPVKYRSVVVCRLLLDWSVEETADALHIAPGTVKSRLSRALTVLGSTLGHLR